MKVITLVLSLISFSAFAHFEIGTYEGTNNLGLKCEIEFVSKTYFPNIKNPINEAVVVKVHKYGVFTVGHQAIINSETKTVRGDKQRLTGSLGMKDSAMALEIVMDHVKNTPSHFNVIIDNWKMNKSLMYTCSDLEFIKE